MRTTNNGGDAMQWQTGDLVFTQIGDPDNAISAVTSGWKDARVNHMGVVIASENSHHVLEAYVPGVQLTKLEDHLKRSEWKGNKRFLVGRLKSAWQHLVPEAVAYGQKQRAVPYDNYYLTDPGKLYCSELVVDMFRHANDGKEFFPETPMSFKDPVTGAIHKAWADYYHFWGMEVPQGEPGSNPGDISRDARVEIVAHQGF
jgi:hypothetical protein